MAISRKSVEAKAKKAGKLLVETTFPERHSKDGARWRIISANAANFRLASGKFFKTLKEIDDFLEKILANYKKRSELCQKA